MTKAAADEISIAAFAELEPAVLAAVADAEKRLSAPTIPGRLCSLIDTHRF